MHTDVPGNPNEFTAGPSLFFGLQRAFFGLRRANEARYSRKTPLAMLRAMAVASLAFVACDSFGQPATPRPAFEVASIKLNKSGDRRMMFPAPRGGRFTATNVS